MTWRRALAILCLVSLAGCQTPAAAPVASPTVVASTPTAIGGPSLTSATVAPVTAGAMPTADRPETVRVGTINNASDVPFYLADERGYLREQGLAVEMIPFDSAARMIAPLGTDQLDVGGGSSGSGLFNAISRGIGVRIVLDRARAAPGTRFNCLIVRKSLLDSGAVRGFADLRGRVYAENGVGSITTYVFERELAGVGLTLQDLEHTLVTYPDMIGALANGAADLGFNVEPFITQGEVRGASECWRPTGDMEPNFQIAVILYGPTFAEQHADAARRFTVAYLRAVRDYYRAFFGDGQGRDDMLQVIARITATRDVGLLARVAPTWLDPNGSVNVGSLQAVQRWYRERGELTAELDLDRVVDPSFADYALSQIGRVQ